MDANELGKLVDWRIGHHIEAAGAMIAATLNRIADQMEKDHALKAAEVNLRREHLLHVLESKTMADRAAQRLMGLIPDDGVVDLRGRTTHDLRDAVDARERKGPDWISDVLAEETPS